MQLGIYRLAYMLQHIFATVVTADLMLTQI
jgi:hypothetical protein